MLSKLVLVFLIHFNLFLCSENIDIKTNVTGDDILESSDDYYYYGEIKELEGNELSQRNSKLGDNIVYCDTDEDCLSYTPGIENVLNLHYPVVHEAICDNNTKYCTCGKNCYSRSLNSETDDYFYYCGPCGRVGSECYNVNVTCEPVTVTKCHEGFCVCTSDGKFYDVYYCYISYYGYEIALQLAISTCIAIALCLLVASIYNAIGFRRIRRIQDLRNILRSETGVRESPPDDIPPKYDDVVEDLPSYQDAIKMSQSSLENQKDGIVNEAFEGDSNSSQDGAIREPPPAYNVIPAINRKKRYKTSNLNAESNTSNESNKNPPSVSEAENVMSIFEPPEIKTTNKDDCSITSQNNLTKQVPLRSEAGGSENNHVILNIKEDKMHETHLNKEINQNTNNDDNVTDKQDE